MEHIDGYVIGERPAGMRRKPWAPDYSSPDERPASLITNPYDARNPIYRRIVRAGEEDQA